MAGHRTRLFFSLAVADLSGWRELRQTQVVYGVCSSPRDTRCTQFPLFSFWQVAQRNKGGFLSSVSLVLGGAGGTFFFSLRDGVSALW